MDKKIKQNDIFIASIMNPNGSLLNLVQSGITPDNTGFLSIDEYKNTPFVQKTFKDDNGVFNEEAFNNAYIKASNNYKELTDINFYKNLENNIEYSPTSRATNLNSKIRDISPNIIKINNPFESKRGISSMFGIDESDKSIREIAQSQKIWNTDDNKWEDKSPNDLGLLGTLFNKDTLVYAQWDEDGSHFDKELGRNINHSKGEYKLNDDGKFYTETLGNREIYNKEILSPADVLTKDDEFLNNIDFFDSDGKDKSIIGTTFKTIASIAPYLIPGVNTVWGGISAGIQLGSILPTFYKSLENIFTGEDDFNKQSSLWKTMNNVEGFMSRFNQTNQSDYSKEKAFSYENMATMVSQIFSQVHQQKAVASLSKLVPGTATSMEQILSGQYKNRSKLAKQLSLGYMALTSTGDVYADAINGGYDRRTAGISALLSAGGQYAIMQHPMFSWFLDEDNGFIEKASRKTMKQALKEPMDDIEKAIKNIDINNSEGKKQLGSAIKKAKDSIFRSFLDITNDDIIKNSLREGVEEVTEQMVQDATKGIVDTMSSLGITKFWGGKEGSFGGTDVIFSKEGLTNYIMNFTGGLLGGAIFDFQNNKLPKLFNKQSEEDKYSLIRLIANGQTQNLIDEVNRQRKYSGNRYLSPQMLDINGNKVSLSSNEGVSQADLIADSTINYIKQLDGVINQEGLNLSDNDIVKRIMSNNIVDLIDKDKSGIDKLIINDFNKLTLDIVEDKQRLNQLEETEEGKSSKEYKDLKNKLEKNRLKVKDYLDGKKGEEYVAKTLLYFNPEINSAFLPLDKIQYTKSIYKVNYEELPDSGGDLSKEKITKEFKEFQEQPNLINKLNDIFEVYKDFQKIFSPSFKEYVDSNYINEREKTFNELFNSEGINFIKSLLKENPDVLKSLSKDIDNSKLKNFNTDDLIKTNLYNYLVNNNIIDVSNLSDDELNMTKNYFNALSSLPISEINNDYIINNINKLNENLNNKILLTNNNLDNKNLQLDSILNFVENQKTIDNELFLRLNSNLKSLKTNHYNEINNYSDKLDYYLSNKKDDLLNIDLLNGNDEITEKLLNESEEIKNEINNILSNFENDLSISNILYNIKSRLDQGEDYRKVTTEYSDIINELINKLNNILNKSNNSELKNELSELIERLSNFSNNLISINNNRLFNLIDSISKTKSIELNPLYDLLRKLDINIEGKVRKSIFTLLEEESNILSQSSIDNYLKEGYTYDLIQKGIDTLKMGKAIVTGMITKQNENNPFGFNQSIINYLTKNKESNNDNLENYKIISDHQGMMLYNEFNNLIDKLEFLKDLSNSNIESKEKEHIQTREKFNSLLLDYYSNKSFEYNGKSLSPNKNNILNRDDISIENKISLIESEIYNEFNNLNLNNSELINFINEFFKNEKNEEFALSLINDDFEGFTPDMTYLSPKSIFNHLLSVLSVDSKTTNLKLKTVLNNPDFKFAPFFNQEYSAKIAYSLHKNKKLFELAYNNILSEINNLNKETCLNVVSILGISGSGKTSVTGQYILKYLLQDDSKQSILVSGPNTNRIDALFSALTNNLEDEFKENNINKINKKDLFDRFVYYNDNNEESSFIDRLQEEEKEINKGNIDIIKNNIINFNGDKNSGINNVKLVKDENKIYNFKSKEKVGTIPSSIFIDEITHFSKIELELLNEIANNYNITIFTFGDPSQKGYTLLNQKYSISELITVNTPYLKSTIRAANIHKKDNNLLLNILSNKLESISSEYIGNEIKDKQINFLNESNRILKYYENAEELNGEKLVNSLNLEDAKRLFNIINKLRHTPGKEKEILGIITKNGTDADDEINLLKSVGFDDSMFKVFSLENNGINPVQGMEGDYFIVKMPTYSGSITGEFNNEISNYITDLYTGSSRALEGSIIIDSTNQYLNYNISNKKENTTYKRPLDIDKLMSLKEKRINDLKSIVGDEIYSNSNEEKIDIPVSKEDLDTDIEIKEYNDPKFEVKDEDHFDEIPYVDISDENGKTNKIIFHTFYNRLGIISDENDQDSYFVTPSNNNNIQEDLQIYNGRIGEKISKNDIDSFIKLKNIVSLHYDNLEQLKFSINSNEILKDFLLNKIGINSENFINQIKLNNFYINASIYNNSIDRSAFKYVLDNGNKLNNGDIFLRSVIKIKLDNGKDWILSLSALPDLKTINKPELKDKLTLKFINNYNKFYEKLSTSLNNNNNILIPLKNIDKTYISATKGVKLIRENSITNEEKNISADEIESSIPGIFLNKLSNGNINIFNGNIKTIKSEFQKGITETKNLSDDYLKQLTGKPYVVLSFDNNQQLIDGKFNQHRKVYPLNPKSRTLKEMIDEFIDFHNNYNKSNISEKKKRGRDQNIFINGAEGLKLFYLIKQNLSDDNWNDYLQNLMSTIHFYSDKDGRFINSAKVSDNSYLYNSKLIDHLNSFSSYDKYKSYTLDVNKGLINGDKELDLLSKNNRILSIGINILTNYNWLNNEFKNNSIDPFNLKIYNLLNEVFDNISNEKFYYNAFATKVEESANRLQLNPSFLKYFELNIVPEPPRYVININDSIESYLSGNSENIENKKLENEKIVESNDILLPKMKEKIRNEIHQIINDSFDELTNDGVDYGNDKINLNEKLKNNELFEELLDYLKFAELNLYINNNNHDVDHFIKDEPIKFGGMIKLSDDLSISMNDIQNMFEDLINENDDLLMQTSLKIIENFKNLYCI